MIGWPSMFSQSNSPIKLLTYIPSNTQIPPWLNSPVLTLLSLNLFDRYFNHHKSPRFFGSSRPIGFYSNDIPQTISLCYPNMISILFHHPIFISSTKPGCGAASWLSQAARLWSFKGCERTLEEVSRELDRLSVSAMGDLRGTSATSSREKPVMVKYMLCICDYILLNGCYVPF